MKRIFITLISVLVFSAAFAQENNDDAVFEKITKTYTLNEDGSMSYRQFKQIKLLTHSAFNRFYGETFIIYNPDFQDLVINESYTIMADGKKIVAPDNAFNVVLPRGAAHSATFNHMREMVCTHTGLELGATIYLDYTLNTKSGFWPALMGDEMIQESSPVQDLEVVVKVQSDVELYNKMFNLRTGPEVMLVGGQKVYTWSFKGLKALPRDAFQGDMTKAPRLIFSTLQKTGAAMDWVMRQKAFDYSISDDMSAFVHAIVDRDDELGTLLKIQKELVSNLKYDHVPSAWMGFRVRTPAEVWESNGGNQFEKAILLASLLKEADFNAAPVLVCPRKFYDKNIADLLLFNQAAVKVNTKGHGTIYLSPTSLSDQSLEYSFGDKVVVPLYKDADFSILEPSAGKNEINLSGDFTIASDLKLTGLMDAELYGAANPFLSLAQDVTKAKSKVSGGIVAEGEGAVKMLNSNVATSQVQFEVSKENPFDENLGYYRWHMPEMKNGFSSWHIAYLSTERKGEFVLPFPLVEKYEYSIEIPVGYEFVNAKKAVNLKNKAGSVKIEISPKKNTIFVYRQLSLNNQVIPAENYAAFRELINEWLDENQNMIVFRKAVD